VRLTVSPSASTGSRWPRPTDMPGPEHRPAVIDGMPDHFRGGRGFTRQSVPLVGGCSGATTAPRALGEPGRIVSRPSRCVRRSSVNRQRRDRPAISKAVDGWVRTGRSSNSWLYAARARRVSHHRLGLIQRSAGQSLESTLNIGGRLVEFVFNAPRIANPCASNTHSSI
jgi:hypothetical protein